jgi:hypothetical protein
MGFMIAGFVACGYGQTKPDQTQSESKNPIGGKLVTFDKPADWILQKHLAQGDSETFQFLIPDAATDGTPDSANAGITIEPVRDGMNVTNFAFQQLQAATSSYGYAAIARIFADKWGSAVSRGQREQMPYIIMDRFGVDQGVMVFFRVAQPVFTNDAASVALSISNFNAVVRSLKIGGSNSVNSEVRQDHGTIWLRAFDDMDTNWMVSPTNKSTYRSPLPLK